MIPLSFAFIMRIHELKYKRDSLIPLVCLPFPWEIPRKISNLAIMKDTGNESEPTPKQLFEVS